MICIIKSFCQKENNMKKIISVVLILIMVFSLSVTSWAAKISPEGRTINNWNNWSIISGTAVTTRIDPQKNGYTRDEMIKIDAGTVTTSFDKTFDGVTKVTVDVYGEAAFSLCGTDGSAIATVELSNNLINETACTYNANAWNKVVVYVLPALNSYDVHLYEGETHTKVYSGTLLPAAIAQFSVSTATTAYIDNIKVEGLEQQEKLKDENLVSEFTTSTASDFSMVNGSGSSSTSATDYRYRDVEFEGETVFCAEDRRNESGTSTRTARYAYKKLDSAISGSAVYSFDIYAAPTHIPTGATEAVDNDARLIFYTGGIKTDQILYLQQTKLTASTDYSIRYPEGRWFNLRVEIVKETGYVNYYVTYSDDNGENVTNTVSRKADFDTKAVSISLNNRQDRNGIFYLKNITASSLNDSEAALSSFSVISAWEDKILRGSVDDIAINGVKFLSEDGISEYSVPQNNGTVKSVDFIDNTDTLTGKQLVVAVYDDSALSGYDIIETSGTKEYPITKTLTTKEDSVVKVFCWDKDTITPLTPSTEITSDKHMLDGKKVIIIGNSFTYYGKTVIDQGQYIKTKIKPARFNDKGYFYQICKQNGANVQVTNWTWGGHGLNDIFSGSCSADRGHNGHNHMTDLMTNTDMDYDYVIIQPGSGGTVEGLESSIERIQDIFKKENPDVKFILSVHLNYYLSGDENEREILDSLETIGDKYDLSVVNWGRLVYELLNGNTGEATTKNEFNKNAFVVSKSSSDGFHPNMLAGYITTQMLYSAITGEKALGEKYSFCTDKKISSNFNVSTFLKKYYTYDNITEDGTLTGDSLTNFPEIFKTAGDMEIIQNLIDSYLSEN